MLKNSDDKKKSADLFYAKGSALFRNRFARFALPVIGGIIIGLLTTLIMKFMGRHISF